MNGPMKMKSKYCTILLLITGVIVVDSKRKSETKLCFPEHFSFGVSTAAYQIEGAWNVSGKGESVWDRLTHLHPERIFDHKNGDVATDSYHLFKEDVELISAIGGQFYRFSISWPRILPNGFSNEINEEGVKYYDDLINELLKYKIEPMVTMYHWDLPQVLQDLGGWTNPIIADYFVDYARVLFNNYGHKVKIWITFNEPLSFCQDGYGHNDAPGANSSGVEDYMCGHNMLRAHGMVYRMYEREYRNKYTGFSGMITLSLNIAWMEPASTSPEDQAAAETALQFTFGWFAHPIFSKKGDYPPIMRSRIDEMSKYQNFTRSRLPKFTKAEVDNIRGSFDFMAVNHYTTFLAKYRESSINPKPSFDDDLGVKMTQKSEWPKSNSTWLRVVPWGLRKSLNWIQKNYANPIIVITENGVSSEPGHNDIKRIMYLNGYLKSLHAAIVKDGCRVQAYTYWSLLDNFEWLRGFSERFGLYEVDYESPELTRTPRLSARYFAKLAQTGCIPNIH